MTVPRLVVAVAFAAASFAPGPQARQTAQPPQTPQFRTGVETVPVFATVRDRSGQFVVDLTKDDFEIRDNGQVQEITQFTTDAQPLSVVLMLDGSGSMMSEFDRVIEGANSFILRMLPADRARVGSFADRVQLGPRFTGDRDELLAYLEDQFNLRVGVETHLWEAIIEGSLALNEQPGMRVVLVLSDGYNFIAPQQRPSAAPGAGGRNPLGGRLPPGMPPIGRGPTGGGSVPIVGNPNAMGPMPGPSSGEALSVALGRDVMVYAVSMWVLNENRREKPSPELERLAVETGGSFTELAEYDEINPAFTQIARELHQQYLLGFTPKTLDGKTHKLEIKVKRSGVRVQARKSYLAVRGR